MIDMYATPGIPPGNIRRWSRWVDVGDRVTKYQVADDSPAGALQVPVRVLANHTHPAAGSVFYVARADFGVRLRPVIA